MFDRISIKHSIISSHEMSVDKVSICIVGMMQPEFVLPNIEAGNNLHGLYRSFFICAPNILFLCYDKSSTMPNDVYFKLSKVWLVIVYDEVIRQSDTAYKFSTQAKEAFKYFLTKNLMNANIIHLWKNNI